MSVAEVKKKAPDNMPKRLARLAAVQGLYQLALTGGKAKDIIRDFMAFPPEILVEDNHANVNDMDRALFGIIVAGVTDNVEQLDEMLGGALDPKFSVPRLEILLRSILRAGTFELHHQSSTAAGIIINDYVDVAHAFFNEKEPGLVNAILDKLAKKLR